MTTDNLVLLSKYAVSNDRRNLPEYYVKNYVMNTDHGTVTMRQDVFDMIVRDAAWRGFCDALDMKDGIYNPNKETQNG